MSLRYIYFSYRGQFVQNQHHFLCQDSNLVTDIGLEEEVGVVEVLELILELLRIQLLDVPHVDGLRMEDGTVEHHLEGDHIVVISRDRLVYDIV